VYQQCPTKSRFLATDCHQASQVEAHASRHLLLEINRVSEELEIILEVLGQQKKFFTLYRELLDPARFDYPTPKRRSRFPYENNSISRNIKAVDERITDCKELQKRANRLADQDVRLVETYQDDNNKTLLIFTVVTITFLPLSFVTGFFGMNVQGISGTTSSVKHFWAIAIPVTVGVVMVSLILTYWGPISRKGAEIRKWAAKKRSKED
jgi:Mg2+ and Co2+ transporter CorA